MKVLITGGAGFIGSHVVDAYVDRGYDVVVVDDLSTGKRENLNPAATFYPLDIRDPGLQAVFEKERPEIVNHHAAQIDVRRSVSDPLFDAEVNILGSLNVLENARKNGVRRFIYISTGGAVYGEPVYLPCDEDHPIDPVCQYGASKHAVEHYLLMYRELYGLDYVVLRYPNVYGPRQDPHGEAGVVAIFAEQMLNGAQVVINGDGDQERDFVFVRDCAAANLLVTEHPAARGIYNLASEVGTSINELYDHMVEYTGYLKKGVHGPAKLGETRKIYLTARKALLELGWEPQVGLAEGLMETVQYFRERQPEV